MTLISESVNRRRIEIMKRTDPDAMSSGYDGFANRANRAVLILENYIQNFHVSIWSRSQLIHRIDQR